MADLAPIHHWFKSQGWTPFPFQEQAWSAFAQGQSGLIHVPTGAGKTYAAYMGPLAQLIADAARMPAPTGRAKRQRGLGPRVIYLTPLRAVSRDIGKALLAPTMALAPGLRVESRTGDTAASLKAQQRKHLPEVLITTPESLSLLLTHPDVQSQLTGLSAVLLDEWHELLSTKRGTLTELALARLRQLAPGMKTWALTATLSNVEEAARAAVGFDAPEPRIIRASLDRPITIETLLPPSVSAFPWAGELGLVMQDPLANWLDPDHSTLIFTNTRNQAERWYSALLSARPQWADVLALHHGSLDRDNREAVEGGLKSGALRLVVCTSSLDLGVDFAPVERVVQIGSPKGIARLIQRAGRSGHRPGEACHILCVPTHALQLAEIAAVRAALAQASIEARAPQSAPLDVLAQHLVTLALGGGFHPDQAFAEVRTTSAYQTLARTDFDWALALVEHGGQTLRAYPEYHRVERIEDRCHVTDRRIARIHRMNVGTITAHSSVIVKFQRGGSLGQVEESFISRLHRGDRFLFAGRILEFLKVKDMVAYVRLARGRPEQVPRWAGGRMPLSSSLSAALRLQLNAARQGHLTGPEMQAARPIFEAQLALSALPAPGQLLIESLSSREGHHLFIYPFEGRLVHEGLAALLALRLGRRKPATFTLSANDYGLELVCPEPYPWTEALGDPALWSTEHLATDALESVNLSELAKRQFREIARVAGLVVQSYPGSRKSTRQVQASAGLIFDVFERYDPDNLLLHQARREVLEQQFEQTRLAVTLDRMQQSEQMVQPLVRPTPLAFPLMVERLGGQLSTESLLDRVKRMTRQWTPPST